MKKLLIILLSSSALLSADIYKDLEISNELLAIAGYGEKLSWTVDELKDVEILISEFSDDSLKLSVGDFHFISGPCTTQGSLELYAHPMF